jgi:uncharacterized membrane protein YgcG
MLNVDLNQLEQGDLSFIKKLGLTISNPDTKEPIAIGVSTWKEKLADWFDSEDEDDDDDFFFPSSVPSSSGTLFGGASLGGIFTGGFGGFGGGSFGGGGVTRGF